MADVRGTRDVKRGDQLLKHAVMRADRARLGMSALALTVVHVCGSLALQLPLVDAAAGLAGLLLLLLVHRTLLVRFVPSLPKPTEPSLLELARVQWLPRGVGAICLTLLLLVTSLGYHGILTVRCDTECAPPSTSFAASWAVLVALSVASAQALGGEALPSADSWPLVARSPFVRMRPALPAALARASRFCARCAAALLVASWLVPSLVTCCAALALNAFTGCPPCAAVAPAGGAADEPAAGMVPGVRALLALMARGVGFHASATLVCDLVRVVYTQPLDFRAASASTAAGQANSEVALEAALDPRAPALTQHLAFLDAATFAQHEPQRRQAIYAIERGPPRRALPVCTHAPSLPATPPPVPRAPLAASPVSAAVSVANPSAAP